MNQSNNERISLVTRARRILMLVLSVSLLLTLTPLNGSVLAENELTHEPDGSYLYVEAAECSHVHNEACGIDGIDCEHVCDENCIGLDAGTEPLSINNVDNTADFIAVDQPPALRLVDDDTAILVGSSFSIIASGLVQDTYVLLPEGLVFDEAANSDELGNLNISFTEDEAGARKIHLAACESEIMQLILEAEQAGTYYLGISDEETDCLLSELLCIQVCEEQPVIEPLSELVTLAEEYTVTFMTWAPGNDEHNPASFTSVFDTQVVGAGETCVDPGVPTVLPPKGTGADNYDRVFICWQSMEVKSSFSFTEPIESDLVLYARFGPDWSSTVQVSTLALLKSAITGAPNGVSTTIELTANITYTTSSNKITIPANKIILLTSANLPGAPFTINGAQKTCVIEVAAGGNLTIENINIIGGRQNGKGAGVSVNGRFTMNSGRISGNENTSSSITSWFGGGVCCNVESAVFILNGGEITGNAGLIGAGIGIDRGTVIVNGGSIYSNTKSHVGGGIGSMYGIVIINGGDIYGHQTSVNGGGVAASQGILTINGGRIYNNRSINGGGVRSETVIIITGGTIFDNYASSNGGGILLQEANNQIARCTILGGVIENNQAGSAGGGIQVSGANVTLSASNSTIANNTAANGGGIWSSISISISNLNINNNIASNSGGGIFLNGTSARLSAENSTISSNVANGMATTAGGGAIFTPNLSYVTLKNITLIENNSALTPFNTELSEFAQAYHDAYIQDTTYSNSNPHAYSYDDINYIAINGFGIIYRQNYGDDYFTVSGPVNANASFPALLTKAQVDALGWTDSDNVFKHWSLTPDDSSGPFVRPVNFTSTDANIDLYAIYESPAFSVSYELSGGPAVPNNPTTYNLRYSTFPISITNPTRAGAAFLGWTATYDSSYPDIETPTTSFAIPAGAYGDLTLTAHWQLTPYPIIYMLGDNGVNDPDNPDFYDIDSSFPIPISPPTMAGYSFVGWTVAYESNLIADIDTPTSPYTIAANTTGSVNLTAHWRLVTYQITYQLNSGINAGSNPTSYDLESAPSLVFDDPSRAGYTFTGWTVTYTDGSEPGESGNGATYKIPAGTTGTITLSANWSDAISYSIFYELNGGTNDPGNPESYDITKLPLPISPATRPGHYFLGWTVEYDDPNLADIESPLESYVIPNNATGDIWLSAVWSSAIVYTISYSLNGGINHPNNPTTYTVQNASSISPEAPSRLGYEFVGWMAVYANNAFADDTEPTPDYRVPEGVTEGITLAAVWSEPIEYQIDYDYSGGHVASPNPSGYSITNAQTQAFADPERSGYSFIGWTVAYANDLIPSVNVPFMPYSIPNNTTGDIMLTAHWQVVTYQISYVLAGGSVSGNPTSYNLDNAAGLDFTDPARLGYEFTGWAVSYADGSTGSTEPGVPYVIPEGMTGNISLVATWSEPIAYPIDYDYQGGTTEVPNPSSYTVVNAPSITFMAPSRSGYNFIGWTVVYETQRRDPVSSPVPSYVIPNSTTGRISLTAHWLPQTYQINYSLAGGANPAGNPHSYSVETAAFTQVHDPTRTGYDFMGWSVTYTDGVTESTVPGEPWSPPDGMTGNIILVATWSAPLSFMIHYELGGGVNTSGNPASYSIETAFPILIADPSYAGHSFAGWTVAYTDGSQTDVTVPTVYYFVPFNTTGDITLTAHWSLDTYYITYTLNGGANDPANPYSYTAEDSFPIQVIDPTRTGYEFLGWTVTYAAEGLPPVLSPVKDFEVAGGVTGNIQLAAEWSAPMEFVIGYQLGDGENSPLNPAFYSVASSFPILISQPTQTGYSFVGWTVAYDRDDIDDITTPVMNVFITKGMTGAITFTAHWSDAVVYPIAYVLGGGLNDPANPAYYSVESSFPIAIADPSRPGFDFLGWTAVFADPDIADITTPVMGYEITDGMLGGILLVANWQKTAYTIHFSPGPGTGSFASVSDARIGESVVLPTGLDYSFNNPSPWLLIGFHEDETMALGGSVRFSGSSFVLNETLVSLLFADGDATLYAVWEQLEPPLLIYDANGGSGNVPLPEEHHTNDFPQTVALKDDWQELHRAGYEFVGWSMVPGADNAGGLTDNVVYTYTGQETTVYAVWSPCVYTVVYDVNLGYGTVPTDLNSYSFAADTAPTVGVLFDPRPQREGYGFLGWSRQPDALVADYSQTGTAAFAISGDDDVVITLYAAWRISTYTVVYQANGGGGAMDKHFASHGESYTLAANAFSQPGYAFVGWNTEAGGGGTAYSDAQTLTVTESLTLYAQWGAPIQYEIGYELNGGINAPANPATYCVEDSFPVSILDPSMPGYEFLGWTAVFADPDLPDLTVPAKGFEIAVGTSGAISLTAHWSEPVEYGIAYQLLGGTNAPANPGYYTVLFEFPIMIDAPTRPGFAFAGWELYFDDPEIADISTPVLSAYIAAGTACSVTLVTNWDGPIDYSINYELNGGELGQGSPTTYNVEGLPLPVEAPSRPGYGFAGWTVMFSSGSAANITVPQTAFEVAPGTTGDIDLTAHWTAPLPYMISYELDGGINPLANPATYTVEDLPLFIAEPARDGYHFLGWTAVFDDPSIPDISQPIAVLTVTSGTTGDIALRAWWSDAVDYSINYELNGGVNATGNPATYSVDSLPMSINAPARAGYTFVGWQATYLNGSLPDVSEATLNFEIADGATGNIVLTAVWSEPIRYPISYQLDGGVNSSVNPPDYNVEELPVAVQEPSRPGYDFKGWTVEFDNPALPDILVPVRVLTLTSDVSGAISLTAHWDDPLDFNIEYQLAGGTNAPANPLTFTVEDLPLAILLPTRPGYDFTGWKAVYSDGSQANVNIPVMAFSLLSGTTGEVTLIATWSYPLSFSINYLLDGGENQASNPARYTVLDLPLGIAAPTQPGFDFLGWTAHFEDPSIPDIISPVLVLTLVSDISGDITLTAHWSNALAYPIEYTLEGGMNAAGNPTSYSVQSSFPLAISDAERPGYMFVGWKAFFQDGSQPNITDPVTGFQIEAGTTGPITLLAIWSAALEYPINYEMSGGVNLAINPASYTVESDFPITIESPLFTGYDFLGWTVAYERSDLDDVALTNPDVPFELPAGTTGGVTMTANWSTPLEYPINYNLEGGVNAASNPLSYNVESSFPIHIAAPSRAGFDFLGWTVYYSSNSTRNEGLPVPDYSIPAGSTGAVSLTAHWSDAVAFIIVYDFEGGESNGGTPPTYTVDELPLAIGDPVRDMHVFTGWTAHFTADGLADITVPTASLELAAGTSGDIELLAHWSAIDGVIDLIKAADAPDYIPGQTVGYSVRLTLPADVSGYQRLRIEDLYPANQLTYVTGSASLSADGIDVGIAAIMTQDGVVSAVIERDELLALDGAALELLLGFHALEEAGGDITNTASVYVTPLGGIDPSQAQAWSEATLTEQPSNVIYDGNGNSSGTPPVDTGNPYPARSEVTVLAAGDLAKPGSSFIGWATAADATAPEYQPGDVMQLVADTTLYAVWKVDVTEFSKAALADGYLPGQSVSFNISFILPTDVHGYDWLRIVDEYPSSLLDYEPGSAELRIGGEPVEIAAVYQMEGEISFIVEGDELLGKGLDQLVLTLSFTVANAASGQITNSARLFIVPLDGYEPEYPDNDAQTSLGELSLYTLTVEGGSGSGSYVEGVTVAISAAAAPAGKVFDRWIGADAALFDDVLSASTNLTMPAQDITISATYKPDTTDASLLSVLGISPDWVSGSGLPTDPVIGGIFVSSDVAAVSLLDVTVAAGASVVLYTDAGYTQAVDAQGSVTLAAGAITTVYVRVASPDGSAVLYYTIAISRAAPRYSLLVEGGSGSGSYVEGAAVTISAAAVPAGKVFDRWIGADAALFDDVLSPETNFTMPAQDVVLTALYRDAVLYPTAEQFGTHTGSGANSGRVGGPYNGFIRLTLDGAAIDPANYSVGAGLPDGTVITLHPGYLTTLANGTYVFRVEFTDGYAYITLVVDRPDAPGPGGGGSGGKLPVTGDSIGLLGMLGFADAFASGTLCILLWAVTGRRKPREERATKC